MSVKFVTNIGFDTAENEPPEVLSKIKNPGVGVVNGSALVHDM